MSGRGGTVRHYLPGGLEHGGGIGRFVGYLIAADGARCHRIVDTRGPRMTLGSPFRLLGAMGAMAMDRVARPSVIHHIHVAGRGSTVRKLVLTFAARLLGCRHLLHLHDYDYAADYMRRRAVGQALVRRMFQGADEVIVLGQRDRRLMNEELGVAQDRVSVFHNCVPDPGPIIRPDRAFPTILFLGRLSDRKGVPELLEALASPEVMQERWTAILAGDGPVSQYRERARELGIFDRIEMPGWLPADAVETLLRRADILVLPSHAEGMSMAVLEGLAHGLAVVTTPVGAHEEAIADGMNGIFVPPGDVPALSSALGGLLRNPGRRHKLAGSGRALFLSRFSMSAYLPRLEALYATIGQTAQQRGRCQDPEHEPD